MAVLFAAQSLLHCLAVFGSALADCSKVSSPTNAAHAAAVKVGLITHSPGNIPLDAYDFEAPRGAKLPRWPTAGRNEPDRQHGYVHSLFLPWGIITLTKQPPKSRTKPASVSEAGAGEVTPAMFGAGVHAIMDFFPAEWGSRRGIRQTEASAVLTSALNSMGLRRPSA